MTKFLLSNFLLLHVILDHGFFLLVHDKHIKEKWPTFQFGETINHGVTIIKPLYTDACDDDQWVENVTVGMNETGASLVAELYVLATSHDKVVVVVNSSFFFTSRT